MQVGFEHEEVPNFISFFFLFVFLPEYEVFIFTQSDLPEHHVTIPSGFIPTCCNALINRIWRIYARMVCVAEVIWLCLQNWKEKSFSKKQPHIIPDQCMGLRLGAIIAHFDLGLPEFNPCAGAALHICGIIWADSSHWLGICWCRRSGLLEQQAALDWDRDKDDNKALKYNPTAQWGFNLTFRNRPFLRIPWCTAA